MATCWMLEGAIVNVVAVVVVTGWRIPISPQLLTLDMLLQFKSLTMEEVIVPLEEEEVSVPQRSWLHLM